MAFEQECSEFLESQETSRIGAVKTMICIAADL